MLALQIDDYGSAGGLTMRDAPEPSAGAGQALVRIHATTYNPIDSKLASGAMREFMPLSFPWTPGSDFSGVVEAVGEGVEALKAGDEVYGYSPTGGAYAAKIAGPAQIVALKPRLLSHEEAASLALVAQTAQQALDAAGLAAGQTLLIQGASGGVGTVAVQLAHGMGARVIAVASADAADLLKSLGADEVIDYKAAPFESALGDRKVDAVLDGVGGDTQQRSFAVLKPGGVLVALTQPPPQDDASKAGVRAMMLQTKPSAETLDAVTAQVDAGKLKPLVGKVVPLAEAATVWQDWPTMHVTGKLVFDVAPR